MGLTESVGKTYDSETFCTMNSAFYRMNRGVWERFDYNNLGLLFNQKRSSEKSADPVGVTELGTLQRKLLETCPRENVSAMRSLFLYYHANELKSFKGPWFLPGYLCGLGLDGELSAEDRRKARGLKVLYEGGEKVPKIPTDSSWWTWDQCSENLREAYPFVREVPYGTLQTKHTLVSHLLHTWTQKGALTLAKPRQRLATATRQWRNRVQRLYLRAGTTFGSEEYIDPEPKRTSVGIISSVDVPVCMEGEDHSTDVMLSAAWAEVASRWPFV